MKKKILPFTIGIFLIGAFSDVASALDYALEISGAVYSWKEHLPEGTLKEWGPMLTLGAYVEAAPLKKASSFRLRGEGDLFAGVVKYDTFASSFSTSSLTSVSTHSVYWGFRSEIDAGWRIERSRGGAEPFLGLAYREWVRNVLSTSAASGYPENYRTLYGRIGLRVDRRINDGLTLQGTASFDPMLWAEERVNWTDISGEKLTFKNGKQPGWALEFGARGKKIEGALYWKATRFGESDRLRCRQGARICFQPKSDQDLYGVKIGLMF